MQHMKKTLPKATTWIDLQLHREGVDPKSIVYNDVDFDDIPTLQLSHGMYQIANITNASQRFQDGLSASQKRTSDGQLIGVTR